MKGVLRVILVPFIVLVIYVIISSIQIWPIGFSKGKIVGYVWHCQDLCPTEGAWSKEYLNVKSSQECTQTGGKPNMVGFLGQAPFRYSGCLVK